MKLTIRQLTVLATVLATACSSGARDDVEEPKPEPRLPLPPTATAAASASAEPSAAASAKPGPPDPFIRVGRSMFPDDLDPRRARVGWLPSKKAFVIAEGTRDETTRSSLSLVIATEDEASRKSFDICIAAECGGPKAREKLDQVLRAENLSEMIALEPIVFPFPLPPSHPVTIGALAAHVRWNKDHLDLGRKQKLVPLPKVPPSDVGKPSPVSVVASPDGSMLALTYALGDPGPNAPTKTAVYKVPKL
ncbi:MAG: hypothetical protein HOV80_29275 [Polyangiaceae bacterium]|nr:hypothetical protein [Polyangiaceae bacterium]